MTTDAQNDLNSRLEAIFEACQSKKKGKELEAFLEAACDGDVALRDRVLRLLVAHDATEKLQLDPILVHDEGEPLQEGVGSVVGKYKLLEEVGEGGFGVVYMAEQREPVRRKVALKVVKLGMDTRQVVARFEAERQALALMDHPGIAQIYDGGATATGRPFFVMELVRGVPITQYCDDNKLSVSERMKLIASVCQAVDHAHSRGVIHRDLKPNNILVTTLDDRPRAKIIDFGIAKATQTTLTEQTVYTKFNQMIGTPAYMSPEQAGHGPINVDERTDIYSLGVLMYEVLVGATPFDRSILLEAGMEEIGRMLREDDPPKPSTRVSSFDDLTVNKLAAARGVEVGRYRQLTRGDLDWIVMKALEKDRGRRYRQAADLASDIDNYLEGRPVAAGPPTFVYRVHKLVRRNRERVAVVAFFLIAAVVVGLLMEHKRTESAKLAIAIESTSKELDEAEGAAVNLLGQLESREAELNEIAAARLLEKARRMRATGVSFEANLMAAKAMGFEGLGRAGQDAAFQLNHPVLARKGTRIREEIEGFLKQAPAYPMVWQRPHGVRLEIGSDRGFTPPGKSLVAYGPAGRFVFSAGRDAMIRQWDLSDEKIEKVVPFPDQRPRSLAVAASGETVVTGWADGMVRLWSIGGRTTLDLSGHEQEVTSVCFIGDNGGFVSGDATGALLFWDAGGERLGEPLQAFPKKVLSIKKDPESDVIAVAGLLSGAQGGVRFFDLTTKAQVGEWTRSDRSWSRIREIAFRPWRDELAVVLKDKIDLVRRLDGEMITRFDFEPNWAGPISFSPDGNLFGVGLFSAVAVFDMASRTRLATLDGVRGTVESIEIGPDGKTLIAGSSDGFIRMWEIGDRRVSWERYRQAQPSIEAGFSPDSKRLASAGLGTDISLWNVATGVFEESLSADDGFLYPSVRFGPNAGTLIAGGFKGMPKNHPPSKVLVWDVDVGKIDRILLDDGIGVSSLMLSRDQSLLLVREDSGRVRVFSTEDYEKLYEFTVPGVSNSRRLSAIFVPSISSESGDYLITQRDSIEVRVAETGELLTTVTFPNDPGPLLWDEVGERLVGTVDKRRAWAYPNLGETEAPLFHLPEAFQMLLPNGKDFVIECSRSALAIRKIGSAYGQTVFLDSLGMMTSRSLSPDGNWIVQTTNRGMIQLLRVESLVDYGTDIVSLAKPYQWYGEDLTLRRTMVMPLTPASSDTILADLRQVQDKESLTERLFLRHVRAGNLEGAKYLMDQMTDDPARSEAMRLVKKMRDDRGDPKLRSSVRGSRYTPAKALPSG